MRWKLLLLLMIVPGSAQAQPSGCVRVSSGALQCTQPADPLAGAAPARRPIPRPDLAADALGRTNALVEQRRNALDEHRREADEQRAKLRKECLDRLAANDKRATVCSL